MASMGAGMESKTDSSTIIMGQETYLDNFLAIKRIFILKLCMNFAPSFPPWLKLGYQSQLSKPTVAGA